MHKSKMKTCDHVSSCDNNKKQAGSYFVMRAGMGNNKFCLCGLIMVGEFGMEFVNYICGK